VGEGRRSDIYVARLDESGAQASFELLSALRDAGLSADMDHQGKSLKAQMKAADRLGARFVLILGPDELAAGEATLRDMSTKEERRVALRDAAVELTALLR
jgi:histidyl-tRNA synthetase